MRSLSGDEATSKLYFEKYLKKTRWTHSILVYEYKMMNY